MKRDPIGYQAGLSFYPLGGNRPLITVDPLGLYDLVMRTWGEQHHWFPRANRSEIETLCSEVNFKIDAFTTKLLQASFTPGWPDQFGERNWMVETHADHTWIHNWRNPKWKDVHKKNYDAAAGDCCAYLTLMLVDIGKAFDELKERAAMREDDEWYQGSLGMRPSRDFPRRVPYPGGSIDHYNYEEVDTYATLLKAIEDACSDCEDPIDVQRFIMDESHQYLERNHGIVRDRVPEGIAVGVAAGKVLLPIIIKAAKTRGGQADPRSFPPRPATRDPFGRPGHVVDKPIPTIAP